MSHASRRKWRLFCLRLMLFALSVPGVAQSPALTTIQEVRWSDSGWGPYNDENLVGRFTTQVFTVPRLTKVQNYFLRQFDASNPPKYSRHSAALHIDLPY